MSFVVYRTSGLRIVATCNTEAGAKRSLRAHAKKGREGEDFGMCSREHYNTHVNLMTTTHNMMDPERKPIPISMADKGTFMDPATETYWSM